MISRLELLAPTQVIPLWVPGGKRREGISLMEVPDQLTSPTSVDVVSESTVGQCGATVMLNVLKRDQIALDCIARGKDVHKVVADFLDAVGVGVERSLRVLTPRGSRTSKVWFAGVSGVEWWGDRSNPLGAKFQLILEWPKPVWELPKASKVFKGVPSSPDFTVVVAHGGNLPTFPTVTATGTWSELKIGWGGVMQNLPHRAGGYKFNTDPGNRSITAASGGAQIKFLTDTPHFPYPPAVDAGASTLKVHAVTTDPNFTLTVEFSPEATRAW